MGQLEEDVTEGLDYVPGHFQVIRHVRPKFACRSCDAITQAPAPPMPTARQGHARHAGASAGREILRSPAALSAVRHLCPGGFGTRSLDLVRGVGQGAWLLDPIVAVVRAHVFAAEKIHGDDTTVPVLAPGSAAPRPGGSGSMCAMIDRIAATPRRRPPTSTAPTEAARILRPIWRPSPACCRRTAMPGSKSSMVRHALSPVRSPRCRAGRTPAVASSTSGSNTNPEPPKQALDRIAAIYAVEARAAFAPVPERVELRREAAPLLDAFFEWADATVSKLSAKSTLADAFRYAINRREALSRFIADGRLEMDNNIAENAMRCIAVGRKLYLFAGSDAGGDRAASIYTLVQTAKLNDVNPEATCAIPRRRSPKVIQSTGSMI